MTQARLTHLLLIREASDGKVTKGELQTEAGERICYTLEEPWKDNAHNVSCIPSGTYRWRKFNSGRHGQCFQVLDVPGRSDIQIHTGNDVGTDSTGCILIGLTKSFWNYQPVVLLSQAAMQKLYMLTEPEGTLEIRGVKDLRACTVPIGGPAKTPSQREKD